MAWRNTEHGFGLVSRMIHWAMALLVLGLLILGLFIANMQPSLGNLWLYGAHKTAGIIALCLVLSRLFWHRISPVPGPKGSTWHTKAAKWAHRALYACLIVMPLSGWVASSATGLDVVVFDRFTLPNLAPVSEIWETVGFAVHRATAYLLMAVVALHIAGALMRRDGTLARMIWG